MTISHQSESVEWEVIPLERQTQLISLLGRMALKQMKLESLQEEVANESLHLSPEKQNPRMPLRP